MRLLTSTVLLFGLMLSAQTYPDLSGMTLGEIQALPDWNILIQSEGLLDGDSLNDIVIVLESKDSIMEVRCQECEIIPNKTRIILVLTTNKSSPKVRIQNNHFIARPNEGGRIKNLRPQIKIADKRLSIFYQYEGSNSVDYGFEFRKKALVLVYAKQITDHDRKELEVKHYDFIQGSLTIEISRSFDVEKRRMPEELFTTNVLDISHHKMKPLAEFWEMYSWEILEYHQL